MYSLREIPSPTSLFTFYASVSASVMLVRSVANDLLPPPLRTHLHSFLRGILRRRSDKLTLIIEEGTGISKNQVYEAAEVYLSTKIGPEMDRIKISKAPQEPKLTVRFEKGERFGDYYEGIQLHWRFNSLESHRRVRPGDEDDGSSSRLETRFFELSFEKKHKDRVLSAYIPFVLNQFESMRTQDRVLKLCTLGNRFTHGSSIFWDTVNLDHPSTFDTLALDPDLKWSIIEDLDRFVSRREFYRRAGRAWKRGYLLYGPPGTGKSSLIAAMANHLRFDIYDLQLGNLTRDSDLRRLLVGTSNRSILVIEDIDCTIDIPNRKKSKSEGHNNEVPEPQLTLSGLLNFIDGLWSSCGDERIIIFTTNHKEKLDSALLRPGRMDMHIHMSYLTFFGFRTLASNYLGINGHHPHQHQRLLFGEIERLISDATVTPAQVAEELMRAEDPDAALQGVVKLLKRKNREDEEIKNDLEENNASLENGEIYRVKRQKIENGGI